MQVCWAAGIAAGMKMLHRANILHLDLAARNVLLADDILVPKVHIRLSTMFNKPFNLGYFIELLHFI